MGVLLQALCPANRVSLGMGRALAFPPMSGARGAPVVSAAD